MSETQLNLRLRSARRDGAVPRRHPGLPPGRMGLGSTGRANGVRAMRSHAPPALTRKRPAASGSRKRTVPRQNPSASASPRRRGCSALCHADPDGFGAFAALGDVDQHALAFSEGADAGALQHRSVHKGILAAALANNEAEAFLRVEPLDRAHLFDSSLERRPACGWVGRTPRRCRSSRTAVNAEDLGDLWAFLTRRHADLERFARLYCSDAGAFEDRRMKKGICGAVAELDEAKSPFRLEPFDNGADRRSGGGLEP